MENKFKFSRFSVVVVAKDHNPSILNPDFLKINQIVPGDFESTETIVTPQVSLVKFKNNITITVESRKLQIVDDLDGNKRLEESLIADMAIKYIKKLPHVNYQSVGINFIGHIRINDPGKWIKSRFLREGEWDSEAHAVEKAEVKLFYKINKAICTLTIEEMGLTQNLDGGNGILSVVVANSNYHNEISLYPGDDAVVEVIKTWKNLLDNFKGLLKDVLKAEV